MTSTLLNIAGKIDPQTVALFETVSSAIADLDMPYVVVGATARDLVLHYGHGARVQRATLLSGYGSRMSLSSMCR